MTMTMMMKMIFFIKYDDDGDNYYNDDDGYFRSVSYTHLTLPTKLEV